MLAEYIRQAQERADRQNLSMVSVGEIRPTNIVPVIAPNVRNREPSACLMQWTFMHPTNGKLVFNIRRMSVILSQDDLWELQSMGTAHNSFLYEAASCLQVDALR